MISATHWLARLCAGAALIGLCSACGPVAAPDRPTPHENAPFVLATETFLADIAQNVMGDRMRVSALIPTGVDPHNFEPTPQDLTHVASCQVLIVNGAGLEVFLEKLLQNAGGQHRVIEASAGLSSRAPGPNEAAELNDANPTKASGQSQREKDPHFWLDPLLVVRYVENIRDGLSEADPAGASTYAANADRYIQALKQLDQWIRTQVAPVPPARRLMVTNHESLGYFADRYGFTIVGMIIPSISTGSSPSARQMARLADQIRAAGAPAIFLETGANAQLAKQVAQEGGVHVVTELYSHSLGPAGGPASSYLDMMRYNTNAIVGALK